jgi:hypothetical protein
MGWLIWKSQTPGSRVKIKTSAAFVPTGDRPATGIIATFDRLHTELIDVTRQCDGLPIDRIKIASPFNEKARYNIYAALTITATHDHRHLLQAEKTPGIVLQKP